ncbi:MAG: periplasmic heavy metal sensor [Syntrophobacterales bacterium]|nr:MAG: periplasmic heavy metal sensor [Syntrophobacterales bacterium]
MKSTRKSIVVMAVVLAVVFAVSSVALARGFGGCGGGSCAGPGFGWGPGSGGQGFGGPGLGAVMSLNLSDSQRDQAIKITETYQIDRIKARGELIKGRDNLNAALQADEFKEDDARQAFQKLSSIREDMFIGRTKMMAELKAILTPEQVELWDELNAGRSDRSREREDYRGRAACGGPASGGLFRGSPQGPRDCPQYR